MPSENGLTRREELLVVATKLFAARGYHGTRMDDVADVVGLNKATVYHYYASKSLILYDIYQQAAERTLTAVHDDPSMSAREALYQYTVRLLTGIAGNPEGAAVYFQEQPYITEWFTEEQVAAVREKETQVYEHVHGLIDRGIASGEFYECDSHVLALGYIGMTLGAYRWLRPSGRRSAKEIAAEFSTALLRGLIRDEAVRVESPLGVGRIGTATASEIESTTMTDMFRLDGKVAVVTGGGRGIGVMMARGLLQAGATVYLSSRKKAELDAAVAELSAHGPVQAIPADLGTVDGVQALVADLAERETRSTRCTTTPARHGVRRWASFPNPASTRSSTSTSRVSSC